MVEKLVEFPFGRGLGIAMSSTRAMDQWTPGPFGKVVR